LTACRSREKLVLTLVSDNIIFFILDVKVAEL